MLFRLKETVYALPEEEDTTDTDVSPWYPPFGIRSGMTNRELPAYALAIRRARAKRQWSRPRLAYELEQVIKSESKEPPGRESLIRMLRAWENGEHKPDDFNRERLATALAGAAIDFDIEQIRPAPIATPSSPRKLKTTQFVAWIAEHSALSFQDAYEAVAAHAEWLEAQPPAMRHAQEHARNNVTRQDIAKALVAYYGDASSGNTGATFYKARVGGSSLTLSIMTKRVWLGTAVQLDSEQERFLLNNELRIGVPVGPLVGTALEAALLRLASVEVTDTVLVNNPLYRLLDISMQPHHLGAVVAVGDFADYALTNDLLEIELIDTLAATARKPLVVLDSAYVASQLPLRNRYLPTITSALTLNERLCVGGPVALLAAARGSTRRGQREPDLVLLVQERSARVVNVAGKIAVVPKSFHAPTVEAEEEVPLSASLERELEEELLGREDLEGLLDGSYRQADPFHADRLSEPMQWLIDRRQTDAYRVECLGFGINMVTGNYEFPCLIMIDDEEWWARYGGQVEANWEVQRIRRYSSRDTAAMQALITDPKWSNESLFAFLEGLRRLAELDTLSRLALPTIEVEV